MNNWHIKNCVGGGDTCSIFHSIASVANLLYAWKEFRKGKRKKRDVALFELHLEDNIFLLHQELINNTFKLNPYKKFRINDPKPRIIHKATVRDRVFNQGLFRVLYPIFNRSFIFDSFSSRKDKGVHLGVNRLMRGSRKISDNWKKSAVVLKCDIAKFFDSVDHEILFGLIKRKIKDQDTLSLIKGVIDSFHKKEGKGIPLGNVTSQLFANIYLNELDRFIKHDLKVRYYFRYSDDFVILYENGIILQEYKNKIELFLSEKLKLKLHPDKVYIRKISQGIDFLGYVVLPHTLILRTSTKKRILRKIFKPKHKIGSEKFYQTVDSYIGVLKHCRSRSIKTGIFEHILENL